MDLFMLFIRKFFVLVFLVSLTVIGGCAGTDHDLSSGNSPATFVPILTDHGVDIFVDEVDGKEARFGELDSVMIDQGAHEITLRIEYQPSSGSAIIVGGLANLLLRAGTNKTFRTQLKIDVEAGHKYRLSAKATSENSLDVFIFDETKDQEVLRHSFHVKDGNFERTF
jgi:hypothetical protein